MQSTNKLYYGLQKILNEDYLLGKLLFFLFFFNSPLYHFSEG